MRKLANRYRVDQHELFQPPRQYPCWGSLPQEVQHKLLQLLARLLREQTLSAQATKERDDE